MYVVIRFYRNVRVKAMKWLKRLCRMLVNRVCDLILSAVPTLGIQSTDFYKEIEPYLMERTDHFLKEFISFATSPHDLATYDRLLLLHSEYIVRLTSQVEG